MAEKIDQQIPYHHGDLKSALIAAAREQIATLGAAALNLRALARTIGVTHPAVYRHFADKEALLDAVAEMGFDELTATLRGAAGQSAPGSEARMHALATAYVNFAVAHPELMRVMFGLGSKDARMKNEALFAASKRAYGMLLESVGGIDGDELINSAIVWALMHGLAQLIVERQLPVFIDPQQREVVITKAAQVLSYGLRETGKSRRK